MLFPPPLLPCREIVKRIDMWGIDMLFVVGGNGGNAGANAIHGNGFEGGRSRSMAKGEGCMCGG